MIVQTSEKMRSCEEKEIMANLKLPWRSRWEEDLEYLLYCDLKVRKWKNKGWKAEQGRARLLLAL